MKLYYSPGTCSLSPHIVLCELGLPHDLERVDLKTHTLVSNGDDYYAVNPKGYVPALELDDGQILTEGPAIVQHLADQLLAARGVLHGKLVATATGATFGKKQHGSHSHNH